MSTAALEPLSLHLGFYRAQCNDYEKSGSASEEVIESCDVLVVEIFILRIQAAIFRVQEQGVFDGRPKTQRYRYK